MTIPNFGFVKRVELTLHRGPGGIICDERSWRMLGSATARRYGPVLEALNAFQPVIPMGDSNRDEVISTLGLRTPDGTYFPFAGTRADRQPRAMQVVSADTSTFSAKINQFILNPAPEPLTVSKSEPYPPLLILFDLLAVLLTVVIVHFWTVPLGIAAFRRMSGATAESISQPIIGVLKRIGILAAWLDKHRKS